jgi:hypothetical protein
MGCEETTNTHPIPCVLSVWLKPQPRQKKYGVGQRVMFLLLLGV